MPYDWCYFIFLPEWNDYVTYYFKFLHHFFCLHISSEPPSILFFFLLQYKFFLSFKNFPNSAEPTWGDTFVWFGFHSLLLSFAPYSWRLFVKIHRESKHPCLHHKKQHKSLISKPGFGSWLPRIYGLNIPSEPYPFTNIHL